MVEHLLCAMFYAHWLYIHLFFHLKISNSSLKRYYPHFMVGETRFPRGYITYPISHDCSDSLRSRMNCPLFHSPRPLFSILNGAGSALCPNQLPQLPEGFMTQYRLSQCLLIKTTKLSSNSLFLPHWTHIWASVPFCSGAPVLRSSHSKGVRGTEQETSSPSLPAT